MTAPESSAIPHAGLGVMIVGAAALSISVSNILTPIVYDAGTNTHTLLVLRFSSFVLLSGLWLRLQGVPLRLSPRDLLICLGAGIFYTIGSGALIGAFAFIPVSLAILIFFTFPLMTRLAEGVLDRRVPSPTELGCLLAALLGLAMSLGVRIDHLNWIGLALAALAAFGVGVSFLWTGRAVKHVQPTVTTLYMAASGLLIVAPITFTTGAWAVPQPNLIDWIILSVAVLSFAAAFLGMFSGVRLIGASRTAMVMNFEPVFTISLALVFLDETLGPLQLVGAALVIAAIVTSQITSRMGVDAPKKSQER